MLERLAWFLVHRRWRVLAAGAVVLVAVIPSVLTVNDRLTFDAFTDPGSEAFAGGEILSDQLDLGVPNFVLVVTATNGGTAEDRKVVTAASTVVESLEDDPLVTDVASYWTSGQPPELMSLDGRRGLILARITGGDDDVDAWVRGHSEEYTSTGGPIEVRASGSAQFFRDVSEQSIGDFERAELVTIPVILLALLLVFGTVAAAFLPLLVAMIAVVGTAFCLVLMSYFTSVSTFALTITSALGLGLGVDYSLFIVNRFREELSHGAPSDLAVVRTVRTAGRTVLFSALAVLVSLFSLVLIPLGFMRSLGLAAMLTAGISLIGSLVVLPAVLASLGPRIDRWVVWPRSTRPPAQHGVWYRTANLAMRRPLLVAGTLLTGLILVSAPALRLNLGLPDDRTFREGSPTRITGDILREEFAELVGSPVYVVLPGVNAADRLAEIDAFAVALAQLPDVDAVAAPTGAYGPDGRRDLPVVVTERLSAPGATALVITNTADPISPDSERLIQSLRSLDSPFDEVLVSGVAANALDVKERILGALPTVLLFVAVATFVILFLQFGSVLVPLKAILLNGLTIAALLGALVWVFQDGHLAHLLGFTATGSIYINIPILVFALAFGLSMDYEVFLLSRIKEEYDSSGDNDRAVALGLDRSGRIVSAAAVLIALVFLTVGAFSSLRMMKAFGLGLATVVMVDAFIIRGTLVPALMKLAGTANWWAPASLRRLYQRFGISEHLALEPLPEAPDDEEHPALVTAGEP